MSANGESYEARPFLKIRRAHLHNFEASWRKDFIHGLVEIDHAIVDGRLQVGRFTRRLTGLLESPVHLTD
jgi:hypothetical protein